jgi:hypothetical protein
VIEAKLLLEVLLKHREEHMFIKVSKQDIKFAVGCTCGLIDKTYSDKATAVLRHSRHIVIEAIKEGKA